MISVLIPKNRINIRPRLYAIGDIVKLIVGPVNDSQDTYMTVRGLVVDLKNQGPFHLYQVALHNEDAELVGYSYVTISDDLVLGKMTALLN